MNEQELRLIVREAVARHLGGASGDQPRDLATSPSRHQPIDPSIHRSIDPSIHASHSLYQGLVNVTDACVIEPAVRCDHCGYCKSHGH